MIILANDGLSYASYLANDDSYMLKIMMMLSNGSLTMVDDNDG